MRSQFFLLGLIRAIRRARADIVCVEYDPWHLQFLQVFAAMRLARSGARLILVVKKNTFREPDSGRGRLKRRISRIGLDRAAVVVAASDMTRELYVSILGMDSQKIVVQPHMAVDTERFAPAPTQVAVTSTVRIGFVGKINDVKGVPELVEAFSRLRSRTDVDVHLALAGDRTHGEFAVQGRDAPGVTYLGPVRNTDLGRVLGGMDIFVMPARILPDHEEHDGRAVLEAMASGIACVVSDSGILPELVTKSEGRVFPAGDVEALTDALCELVEDAGLRTMLGRNARARALAYVSPQIVTSQRTALFNQVMESAHES